MHWAAGDGILCAYNYDGDAENIGIATPLGNVDALIQSIIAIADNEKLRKDMQKNAIKYAYSHYTAKHNTKLMLDSFNKIVGGENNA